MKNALYQNEQNKKNQINWLSPAKQKKNENKL